MSAPPDDLGRRLADADALLPPPPAAPLTAARLEQLLVRRRRRQAGWLLAGLGATAAVAMLRPCPPAAERPAAPAAEAPQLQRLATELDRLRQRCAEALAPLAVQQRELDAARAGERAAAAVAAAADLLAATDPAAAARQRARVCELWPDTAAARRLALRGDHR